MTITEKDLRSIVGKAEAKKVADEINDLTTKLTGSRAVADAAVALAEDDRAVLVSTSGAGGPFAITAGTMVAGQLVIVMMTAFDTAVFQATVTGGTLEIGAAGEGALMIYDGTNFSAIPFGGADITP